jgi:hypothetical protein
MNHWPDVSDRPEFLRRMMAEFVGGRLSLEGDLRRCAFPDELVIAREETGLLRRNTTWPRQDFVVLPLGADTDPVVLKSIMAAGLKRAIIHVQIERDGTLQVGAYDNFHPECTFTGPGVGTALLAELHAAGVLRGFRVASDTP